MQHIGHTLYMSLPWVMAFLSACTSSDLLSTANNADENGIPISFRATNRWDEARTSNSGNSTTFATGDEIGVFAYYNDSSTPDFMNNQPVIYDGTSWSYSPQKYWPKNENDYLSFYAYYPHRESEDGDTIHAVSSATQLLKIDYCCPNANIDLMASKKIEDQKYSTQQGKIPLSFQHLLAKVQFSFTYDGNDDYHPVIHVLKYTIPHYKGTVTCYTGEDGSTFTWSNPETNEDTAQIARYVSDVAGTVLHEKNQIVPEFTAYLLPYSFPYSATATDNKGSFTISLNNKLYTYTPTSQIPLEAGKSYTINFKITTDSGSSGNYFITSYSIWKDGGTINGTLE